jgi:hypothetical protein
MRSSGQEILFVQWLVVVVSECPARIIKSQSWSEIIIQKPSFSKSELLLVLLQYWDLNSEFQACQAGPLPLEGLCQPYPDFVLPACTFSKNFRIPTFC